MNEAPEGLKYGHDNDRHAQANKFECDLESGKYETGRAPSPEHEKAVMLRELGKGSHDPAYTHHQKNKA